MQELDMRGSYNTTTTTTTHRENNSNSSTFKPLTSTINDHSNDSNPMVIAKLYAIMESVEDRVEMHKNVCEQRNNWNHLLLTSINTTTLTAATMAGIAAATSVGGGASLMALKLSSTLLYASATGMLVVMNKIQPSQLAEEQRNATRLFKQLHGQIQTKLSLSSTSVTIMDVQEAMDRVLALDKAYPLPLLGTMLEKFPSTVEPAVWWPRKVKGVDRGMKANGWSAKLEEEMREIVKVVKGKDSEDYMRLSKIALKVNKILALSGPLLTGLAAVGTTFVGSSNSQIGTLAVIVGVAAGALASVVNTLEHGGQVGMVFEMYRSNAGFFKLMEETIESNLNERDVGTRRNGELFEMEVALQLGRSLSELKHLAASSSSSLRSGKSVEEFASKLF